jgi:ATP-dependent helicase/nuclease subunit A
MDDHQVIAKVVPSATGGSSFTTAEGILDLAFRDQSADFDGWTVVDFKTDQEVSTEARHYTEQVKLYARAVQAATRLPARGIVLVL